MPIVGLINQASTRAGRDILDDETHSTYARTHAIAHTYTGSKPVVSGQHCEIHSSLLALEVVEIMSSKACSTNAADDDDGRSSAQVLFRWEHPGSRSVAVSGAWCAWVRGLEFAARSGFDLCVAIGW